MKKLYRIIRSILLTVALTVAGLYIILYVALSMPAVQNIVRSQAEKFLTEFLGGKVRIGSVQISPFSQVAVGDLEVFAPDGGKVLSAETVGAGINLWKLVAHGNIEITYAELVGLDASVSQRVKGGPLNIDFIIKAFKPKKKKAPSKFDLVIRTVIIRKSRLRYDKEWIPRLSDRRRIDFNHLDISELKADISIPTLRNDCYEVDIRRLALRERSGLSLESLSCLAHVSPNLLEVRDLRLLFPGSALSLGTLQLTMHGYEDIRRALESNVHRVNLESSRLTLADFAAFVPALGNFREPLGINLDVSGNLNRLDITTLNVMTANERFNLNIGGIVRNLDKIKEFEAVLPVFSFRATGDEIRKIATSFTDLGPAAKYLVNCGSIDISANTTVSAKKLIFAGDLKTSAGSLALDAEMNYAPGLFSLSGRVMTDGLDAGKILGEQQIGSVSVKGDLDLTLRGKEIDGTAKVTIPFVDFGGTRWNNILADVTKQGNHAEGSVSIDDEQCSFAANGEITLSGKEAGCDAMLDIGYINFSAFNFLPQLHGYSLSGYVRAALSGNTPETFAGHAELSDFIISYDRKGDLRLGEVTLLAMPDGEYPSKSVELRSDFFDADITGSFRYADLWPMTASMLKKFFPEWIKVPDPKGIDQNLRLHAVVKNNNTLADYFNLPVRMLTEINIDADIDQASGTAGLTLDCPYLQQGKNKLVRDTWLGVQIDKANDICSLDLRTIVPAKDSDVALRLSADGKNNRLDSRIGWQFEKSGNYSGELSLSTDFIKNSEGKPLISSTVNPSEFAVGDTVWRIEPALINFADRRLEIDNLKVGREGQFVDISGTASADPDDELKIALQNVRLDLIFETLNINYVTFGGSATGEFTGTELFSKAPKAFTPGLKVKGLTYNGALLGDAVIKSEWVNSDKHVSIFADIFRGIHRVANVDGGVWVTRDSLDFRFDADKVNIQFLKPFMSAFTSDMDGLASGNAHLYGNFSDIDLTGDLHADTIRMKVDYTNTWYAGSDSVHLRPGRIEIPAFRLYDKEGHSAVMSGWVKHRYFHEPSFEFNVRDARDFLCYNTNSKLNPDWYGTIYGNGRGTIYGVPGLVKITMDMTTAPRSTFTFVLNDTQAAEEYEFLTFSDRRGDALRSEEPDTVPDIVKMFRRKVKEEEKQRPSIFEMNLQVTVTPDARLTLVMDPVGGDKIRAEGRGAMRIGYSSENDEMSIFGKYILEKGSYNFTLQDIIIKDFIIRQGSNITFTGDPFNAILDISGAYRVNASLTDLDKSFAAERDLNRTNVPVEALLNVTGELSHPDISFDIALPTLTEDVTRKVKSIISTKDMMNRQIVYLLALNRFYTPEYMGSQGNNNELASVASSTISSQLTNILGQISDKWRFSPNFRTDKGDFSDTEVDLALSSSLLNNRLLLNGNFGYRDRSTSSTTFIGDFDIEYLLNRSGSLRLKAYNHFNDENYYLKSALTTQGIGVMYKHDFDRWFSFLRRKPRKEKADSVETEEIKAGK